MRKTQDTRPLPGSGFGLAVALGLPGAVTALALLLCGTGWLMALAIHAGAQMLAALALIAWDFRPSSCPFPALTLEPLHA